MLNNPLPKRGRLRRGMTLAECVICVVLVGVALVAALDTVGAAKSGLRQVNDRRCGHQLAQALMEEILQQAYADPADLTAITAAVYASGQYNAAVLGLETGEEVPGDRSLFDDVDDYDGWSASPPQDRDGTEMDHLPSWRREVTVEWMQPNNFRVTSPKERGVKRITVTAYAGDVPRAELIAFVTLGPLPTEACCLGEGACMDLSPDVCTAEGGGPQGADTNCFNTGCAVPAIAHWKLDEDNGTIAGDSAGDHHGTVIKARWDNGVYGAALKFKTQKKGRQCAVEVPDADDLDLLDKFTITAWVFCTDIKKDWQPFVTKGDSDDSYNYWFGMQSGGEVTFGVYDGANYNVGSGQFLSKKSWSFVTVVVDDDEYRFFVDGTWTTRTAPGNRIANNAALEIGSGVNKKEQWIGKIDDVRIYDVILTEEQVNSLFAGEEP